MVAPFDVPGRLAQGYAAVDTVSQYVWASHQVGYQHPDLTVHAAQLRDWYGTEDGMNLFALQQDCAALDAAVRAADEAAAVQERQADALSDAWQGAGARASQDFLHRHGAASADVAHAVRTAVEALRRVGEQVWSAVDAKVDAVVAVDAGVGAARADWLAASATVLSGVGDRAVGAEVVETAVKPFVDSRIRTDWLSAVQAASAAIADAYQGATAEIRAASHAAFAIPGDLGPAAPPPTPPPPPPPPRHDVAPAPIPVSAPAPAPVAAPAAPTPTMPTAWEPPPPSPPLASVPPMAAPLSDLGGGLGGGALGGGALPAVGQRFADALSGLLGGGPGASGLEPADLEPPDLDPPHLEKEPLEDEDDPSDEDDPDEDEPTDEEPDVEEETTEDPPAEPVEPIEPVEPAAPIVEDVPAPTPPPPPPPAEPLPPLEDERTPCAIAADEVPQVGGPAS